MTKKADSDNIDQASLTVRLEKMVIALDSACHHADWQQLSELEPASVKLIKEAEKLTEGFDAKLRGLLFDLQSIFKRVNDVCLKEKQHSLEQLVAIKKREKAINNYQSHK